MSGNRVGLDTNVVIFISKLPDAIILAAANFVAADLLSEDWDDFFKTNKNINVITVNALKNNDLAKSK